MTGEHINRKNGPEGPDQAEAGDSPDQNGVVETVAEDQSELLAQKEEEVRLLQDRLLRMAAELENTRKRLEREKADGILYANESLLRELLPSVDNLERAIEHGENEADFQGLLEGVRMTLKGFLGALAKFGCTPFEAVGKEFDPNFHEALMQQESDEYPQRAVIRELQRGYVLNDRLLRPASVIVSKASGD